ncbi:MAG: branched-chain amino acid transporter permease [Lachnospiraceae bacterium]
MDREQALILIAVMTIVTLLLRGAPFVLFPAGKETPKYIQYLGRVLPYAIMAMLVVYCFRNTQIFSASHGIPEAVAGITVVVLQWWRKNTLLSIAAGTVLYMFLVQVVF